MPRVVPCRCCECGCVVYAVCDRCELRQLEAVLSRRGVVAREHPAEPAFEALVASYYSDADARDAVDRARDLADDYRLGAS